MTLTKSIPLLRQIKEANGQWFSRGNKRFFGDVSYKAYYGKKSGNPYLVRATYAWSDMFGRPKILHYRVNKVNSDTKEIESLTDDTFNDIFAVKAWLRNN